MQSNNPHWIINLQNYLRPLLHCYSHPAGAAAELGSTYYAVNIAHIILALFVNIVKRFFMADLVSCHATRASNISTTLVLTTASFTKLS